MGDVGVVQSPPHQIFGHRRSRRKTIPIAYAFVAIAFAIAADRIASLLDVVYDPLYSTGGRQEREARVRLPFFLPPGKELASWRNSARQILADTEPMYSQPEIGIYDKVLEVVQAKSRSRFRDIQNKMVLSKFARSCVFLCVGITLYLIIVLGSYILGLACLALADAFFLAYLQFRVQHNTQMYRVFCEAQTAKPARRSKSKRSPAMS